MLNLLRFRPDGGRERYLEYATRSIPIAERFGAEALYVGDGDRALVARAGAGVGRCRPDALSEPACVRGHGPRPRVPRRGAPAHRGAQRGRAAADRGPGMIVTVHGNPETAAVWRPLLAELGRDDVVRPLAPGLRRRDPRRLRLHGARVPRLARRRARAHRGARRPRRPRLGRWARRERRDDPPRPAAQLDDGCHRRLRARATCGTTWRRSGRRPGDGERAMAVLTGGTVQRAGGAAREPRHRRPTRWRPSWRPRCPPWPRRSSRCTGRPRSR